MNLNKDWHKESVKCMCSVLYKLNCIKRKQHTTNERKLCGTIMYWGFMSSTKYHINAAFGRMNECAVCVCVTLVPKPNDGQFYDIKTIRDKQITTANQ